MPAFSPKRLRNAARAAKPAKTRKKKGLRSAAAPADPAVLGKALSGRAEPTPRAKAARSAVPAGLRVNGSRATEKIAISDDIRACTPFAQRIAAREMDMTDFIEHHGSGTLRKNKRIGMNVASHALEERIAYEFGYEFECCMERAVTWGEARSESDSHAVTETGWHVDRYASVPLFPGDEIECKYITVELGGEKREGIGIVVRKTSASFVPAGYIVFAIIAEYDPKTHDFKPARNPS